MGYRVNPQNPISQGRGTYLLENSMLAREVEYIWYNRLRYILLWESVFVLHIVLFCKMHLATVSTSFMLTTHLAASL